MNGLVQCASYRAWMGYIRDGACVWLDTALFDHLFLLSITSSNGLWPPDSVRVQAPLRVYLFPDPEKTTFSLRIRTPATWVWLGLVTVFFHRGASSCFLWFWCYPTYLHLPPPPPLIIVFLIVLWSVVPGNQMQPEQGQPPWWSLPLFPLADGCPRPGTRGLCQGLQSTRASLHLR